MPFTFLLRVAGAVLADPLFWREVGPLLTLAAVAAVFRWFI